MNRIAVRLGVLCVVVALVSFPEVLIAKPDSKSRLGGFTSWDQSPTEVRGSGGSGSDTGGNTVPMPLRDGSRAGCDVGVMREQGRSLLIGDGCVEADEPRVTRAMIVAAFHNTPVPQAELAVQPPGGKTLVNFETIFRTEAEQFTDSFTLLGQPVELRISPSTYTWVTGDGASFTTTTPGIAYESGRPMSDYVTHTYARAEPVKPRVNVTWTADFRVGGGTWQPVPGSVTKQGEPFSLRVVEGRPSLVGTH